MTKSKLHLGQKIVVISPEDGEHYKSMIQELDNQSLAITLPVKKEGFLILRKGDPVQIEFALEDAVYSFKSRIVDRKKVNQVSLLIIPRPTAFSRRQRRKFVRLPVVIPLNIQVKEPLGNEQDSASVIQGMVLDLSGGGLQLLCDVPLQKEAALTVSLTLDDDSKMKPLLMKGIVNWVAEDEQQGGFRAGLRFTDISESDRERIIAYIFRKMRQRIPFS